jgi:hypothetical protein
VRRASDNAEQDIEFDIEGNLNTGALAGFCSGTDGFVKIWYCQSGNGNDAEQTTAANQPKIYDSVSGVIEEGSTGNEKPAVQFTSDSLKAVFAEAIAQPATYFFVGLKDAIADRIFSGTNAVRQEMLNSSTAYAGGFLSGAYPDSEVGNQVLFRVLFNGASSAAHINGTQTATGNVGTYSQAGLNLFNRYTETEYSSGKLQEFIMYDSNQNSAGNSSGIETNINDHYNIFTP